DCTSEYRRGTRYVHFSTRSLIPRRPAGYRPARVAVFYSPARTAHPYNRQQPRLKNAMLSVRNGETHVFQFAHLLALSQSDRPASEGGPQHGMVLALPERGRVVLL